MIKASALLDYFMASPAVSTLYFQYARAADNVQSIATSVTDISRNRTYIDGSVPRQADFTFTWFKEMLVLPVVNDMSFTESDKNAADLDDVSAIIEWIRQQNNDHNWPNLGEHCIVDSMYCLTDSAKLTGIDMNGPRPLGRYQFTIRIEYVDYTYAI